LAQGLISVYGTKALAHLVASLEIDLKAAAPCFVQRQLVENYLNQRSSVLPARVEAVRERFPVDHLTRTLRALVGEGVSIRNLRAILERLLHSGAVVPDEHTHVVPSVHIRLLLSWGAVSPPTNRDHDRSASDTTLTVRQWIPRSVAALAKQERALSAREPR